jgi:hypothetical protein
LASALPASEQTDKVFAVSLPVGNWIVFYSFVIDHEIPAYERPLCADCVEEVGGPTIWMLQ